MSDVRVEPQTEVKILASQHGDYLFFHGCFFLKTFGQHMICLFILCSILIMGMVVMGFEDWGFGARFLIVRTILVMVGDHW